MATNWNDFTPIDEPAAGGGTVDWSQFEPIETNRTWGEAAADTAVQLGEGVNNILGAVPNLVAPEGEAAAFFNRNSKFWRDKQSDPMQSKIATADQAITAAGEDGVISQIAEAASQYFSDPALAARFVTTNLPSMIPGIGAAKLSQAAALARGATATGAAMAATTAAGATNAALNAGGARGEAFEDIKNTLIQQGVSPEEAEQKALADSRIVAAIGGLAGFASGKTGLEKSLVGAATTKGALKSGIAATASELAGEQIEEVAPKLATNYQAGQYDNRSIGKDIGRTIVETAIGSGPGAVVAGGLSATRPGLIDQPPAKTVDDILASNSVDEAIATANDVISKPSGSFAAMSEFADLVKAEQSDITQRRDGIARDQEFSAFLKEEQIDTAYLRQQAEEAARRAREFDLAEQARRDADIPAMINQAQDQAVEQAQAITRAQGFDTPEPTAMQLAMERARAKAGKKTGLIDMPSEAAPQPTPQPVQEKANDQGPSAAGVPVPDVGTAGGQAGGAVLGDATAGRQTVPQPVAVGQADPGTPAADPGTNAAAPVAAADRQPALSKTAPSMAQTAEVIEQAVSPTERRVDLARRKAVAEMSQEEMRSALLTSELTGIPNKRAFEEHVRANPQDNVLYGDLDDFKALNTKYGHEGADQILRGVGAIKAEVAKRIGVSSYHRSGDEFLATSQDDAKLKAYGDAVQKSLSTAIFEITMPDGSVVEHKGVGFSYGTGKDVKLAESQSDEQKAERKRLGLRVGQREAVSTAEPGRPDNQGPSGRRNRDSAQSEELKTDQQASQSPTPPDVKAGDEEVLGKQSAPSLAAPFDQSIYNDIGAGKSSRDILSRIAEESDNALNREIAQALLDAGVNPSIEIGSAMDQTFTVKNIAEGLAYAAAYDPNRDAILMFTASGASMHVLHEAVHAATARALREGGADAVRMKLLYKYVKQSGKADGMYGMSNFDEFTAEALSNPEFQDVLRGITAMPSNSKFANAWEWFVDLVRRILRLDANPKTVNALDQALRFGRGLMQESGGGEKIEGGELLGSVARDTSKLPETESEKLMGSVASQVAGTWTAPAPNKMDDVIFTLQDKQVDTKRVVQSIGKAVGNIEDKWNPYLQEELFHGRSAKAVKDFLGNELKPLLQDMQLRGVEIAEFEEYLHNRHAEERNNQIAKVNQKMPDGGSGIDTADARAYLSNLPVGKKKSFEALAKKVDAISNGTKQLLVAAGLETQETVDAWDAAYQYYIPLQREESGAGIGQGFSVRGSASKRAMGSKKSVIDIMANIAMQRERAIVRAEKNRVATALYGLAITQPNPEFWLPVNPDNPGPNVAQELTNLGMNPIDAKNLIEEPTQQYIDPRTGLVAERVNPMLRSGRNVLSVRVNGKDRYVFFNENDERAMRMVATLKNLDADQLGRLLSLSAKVTRFFSSINTQYNPVFGAINLIRDVQGALLNLSTTEIAGKQKEVMAHTVSALRGIYIDLRDHRAGKKPTSSWAAEFEEFQNEGGQTGYRDMFSTSAERANALKRELTMISEGKAKAGVRAVFDWLSDYNETMENAVRLAAYKVAKEQGMSRQQAASLAKNLTVNFNRKGQIATQAGAMYAFFNAAVQGTTRLAQTLRGPAGKKIITGGLLLGSVQALLLAAAGFDDGEPPDFVKDRNLIIPLKNGKYLTVPMPLGFNIIPNISRITTEFALSGFKNQTKHLAHLIDQFADTFNPIGNAGFSLQTITPTAIDPLAALTENRDWTGKPIAKEDSNSMAPTPGYARAKDTASAISKTLSYWINLASGGTKYTPGLVSPTPDQLDYLIGQATGGVGREALKVEQTVTSTMTGEELPPNKVPFFGRFYGDTKGQSGIASRFYDNLKALNVHEAEIKGRRKDRGDVMGYLRDNPDARLVNLANDAERDIQRLKKQKRELLEKDAPKERVKLKEKQITARMKRFNDRVEELRAKQADK